MPMSCMSFVRGLNYLTNQKYNLWGWCKWTWNMNTILNDVMKCIYVLILLDCVI